MGGGQSSGASGKKRVSDAGIEGPEKKKGRSVSPPSVDASSAANASATSTAAIASTSATAASTSAAPDIVGGVSGGGDFHGVLNGNDGQHSGKLGDSVDLSQVIFLSLFSAWLLLVVFLSVLTSSVLVSPTCVYPPHGFLRTPKRLPTS